MTKFTSYLKRTLSLLFLMVAMVTTAWAQDATTVSMSTFTAVSGSLDENISYTTAKGGGTVNPAINNGEIRIYQKGSGAQYGGTITITAAEGFTLKTVVIGSSMATSVSYTKNDETTLSTSEPISANGKYTVENVDAQSITFYCMGTDKNSRLYVNYLEATYAADASSSKADPEISFAETSYTVNIGEAFTAPTLINPYNLTATYSIVSTPAVALDINETTGDITINGAGSATVTATTAETEEYRSGKASYTIRVIDPNAKNFELVTDVNDLKAGDLLIITSGTTGDVQAMNKYVGGSNCKATNVTINVDGTLSEPDASSDIAIITLGGSKNKWTLYDGANYLYAASSSSNQLKGRPNLSDNNDKATITLGTGGNAIIVFNGTNTRNKLQYNLSSKLFSCYSNEQQKIYLYRKPVATESVTYTPANLTLKANSGDNYYATFSNEAATFFPETDADMTFMTEAQTAFSDGDELLLTTLATASANIDGNEINGYFVPANTGVLIKASFDKEDTTIPYYTVTGKTVDALADNMLHPSSETMTGDYYFYKLAYDNISTKTGLGFYWGAKNGGEFTSKSGLAYLAVPKTASAKTGFAFDNSTSGIESAATETSKNDVMYNLAGMRVNNNYKGIVIVNGKKMIRK